MKHSGKHCWSYNCLKQPFQKIIGLGRCSQVVALQLTVAAEVAADEVLGQVAGGGADRVDKCRQDA